MTDVSVDLDVLQSSGQAVLGSVSAVSGVTGLGDVADGALACPAAAAVLAQVQLEQNVRAEVATESLQSVGRRPLSAVASISRLDAGMVKAV